MYKRLDKYIEKMQNVKLPVHKKSDPIMWIRGRNDGKNGYIGIVNGRLTSDYIRRELIMHKRYISNMKQLLEDSIEAVRYEIIRCEFELRCLKNVYIKHSTNTTNLISSRIHLRIILIYYVKRLHCCKIIKK